MLENSNKYIAVFSKNGFAVFDNMSRLNNAKKYLGGNPIRKDFEEQYEAFNWANDGYNDEQTDYDNKFFGSPKDVKLNYILFRNRIREKNLEDYA